MRGILFNQTQVIALQAGDCQTTVSDILGSVPNPHDSFQIYGVLVLSIIKCGIAVSSSYRFGVI